MEKEFKREMQSLEKIFQFIREFASANYLDESISFPISLVAEELFTNMLKYNPEGKHNVTINLNKDNDKVAIVLIDHSIHAFDITKTEYVDVDQPLHKRKIGGIGIHLVKNMVDEIDYQFIDGMSKITLIKYLER